MSQRNVSDLVFVAFGKYVVALDRYTGEKVWQWSAPKGAGYMSVIVDGDRLIAMAGERLCAGDLQEVSGICTHPDFQGRGLAKKLTLKLVRRQMLRGKTSFLHVLSHNTAARGLYKKMGYRNYRETVGRVITRR